LEGQRAVTPYFTAPEVLHGDEGGIPVDIYALGLVIDEMVTREPAFPGTSVAELLWKKLQSEPVPPSARSDSLPSNWEHTILRCLQRDPAKRPQSVTDVLHGLENKSSIAVQLPLDAPAERPPAITGKSWRTAYATRRPTRRQLIATAAAVSLLSGLASILRFGTPPLNGAILLFPFRNATERRDHNYLCTAAVDELTRRLLSIDGLRVHAVRGEPRKPPEASKGQLALEGELQDVQGRLRLSVRLSDYASGTLIWTRIFEEELNDPLRLEAVLADSVIGALDDYARDQAGLGELVSASLDGSPGSWFNAHAAQLAPQATANSSAFEEYVRGRELWQARTLPAALAAIQHLERAVQLDPGFALAHSALADVQQVLLTFNYGDTRTLLAVARDHAGRAVAADSSLPEAHLSLAAVRQMLWNWSGSETSYQTALRVQPRLARAHEWYAGLLVQFGLFDQGLARCRAALELDPFDYPSHSNYGLYLWHARRDREAVAHLEALLAKCDLLYAHVVLGLVCTTLAATASEPEATQFFVKSVYEAGIVRTRELEAAGGADGAGFLKWSDMLFAMAHAARRDHASAQIHIDRLEQGLSSGKLAAAAVAWAQAAIGNKTRTLDLLEAGAMRQEREMLYVKVHPLFRSYHNEPRFRAVLREMDLAG
jgi:TolB-like protein/tetratricopeptide (TPR) repeat protein